ncbi:MAG TPA: hypothetical protein VHV51_03990 [Polyangiaceae bacterium]|nr:hypothetical protein [Polyangiaceae bacterium]
MFRYYLLTAHYRSPLDLNLEALRAADTAFSRLSEFVERHRRACSNVAQGNEIAHWKSQFYAALYDDLDAPRALAVLWCIFADASLPPETRAQIIAELAAVLGLSWKARSRAELVPPEIMALAEERERARRAREFARADALRSALNARGFRVVDGIAGPIVTRTRAP